MGRFDVQTSGGMSGASAYVYLLVDGIVAITLMQSRSLNSVSTAHTGW